MKRRILDSSLCWLYWWFNYCFWFAHLFCLKQCLSPLHLPHLMDNTFSSCAGAVNVKQICVRILVFFQRRAKRARLRQRQTQGRALHPSHTLRKFDQDVAQELFWVNQPREQRTIMSCHVYYWPTSVSHASPKSKLANYDFLKFGTLTTSWISEFRKSTFGIVEIRKSIIFEKQNFRISP